MKDNFFQELEFYDKDNIPDDIYEELALFYYNPTFEPHVIMQTSQAATCLCKWVRAVYQYAQICRTMKPRIQELLDAQQALNKVMIANNLYKRYYSKVIPFLCDHSDNRLIWLPTPHD